MRAYAKVSPLFWVQGSGKRLRGDPEAQALAQHLLSGPSSTMIGLYYLPIPVLAHELGWSIEAATKALQRVCDAGFATYDPSKELAWVFNAARIEFGDGLNLKDRRVKGIINQLAPFGNHPFVQAFLHLYGEAYQLHINGIVPAPLANSDKEHASPIAGAHNRGRGRDRETEAGEQVPAKPLPPQTDSLREIAATRVPLVTAKALHDHWREVMIAEKRGTPEIIASPLLLIDAGLIIGYACGDIERAKRVVSAMVKNPEGDEHWARRKHALELLAKPEQFKQAELIASTIAAGGGGEKHARYEERRQAEEARIEARNAAADKARWAAAECGEPFDLDAFERQWDAAYERERRRGSAA